MPDPDLKVGQLLVVLELIDDKDELFEANLEYIASKVYRAQFEYIQALVELEESLIQNCLVDCLVIFKVLDEIVDVQEVVAIREDQLEAFYEGVFFEYPAQYG
jgi:hypothetical protein